MQMLQNKKIHLYKQVSTSCLIFLQLSSLSAIQPVHMLYKYAQDKGKLATPHLNKKKQKKVTFMTLMAADNDLAHFSRKNLTQQSNIGSNEHINIITQLDTRTAGNEKITKRYYIEKNKLVVMNNNDPLSQHMDSGDPETLISFCTWGIENFPADYYVLVLWNHGTGIIDLGKPRAINPSELFNFNPMNNLIELDRSIPFLEYMNAQDERGVCFDDTTGHYLTNQKLEYALNTICTKALKGKKFGIIAFDACLMAMIEVANIVKNYAEIMVASQEVELGTGYAYDNMLNPFLTTAPDAPTLAKHMVVAYGQTYNKITNDYTQSAVTLARMDPLENNINALATTLLECLKKQRGTSVRDSIKASRHKLLCTHFDEPSYIDYHHFCINLYNNLERFQFIDEQAGNALRQMLKKQLVDTMALTNAAVLENIVGKNLTQAKGLSIYFPERRLHNSYKYTNFAKQNQWATFLAAYLLSL